MFEAIRTATASRLASLAARLRREDGQGGLEYGGVIIAAGLLVLAIIGAASGIGDEIVGGIESMVSDVMGGG